MIARFLRRLADRLSPPPPCPHCAERERMLDTYHALPDESPAALRRDIERAQSNVAHLTPYGRKIRAAK